MSQTKDTRSGWTETLATSSKKDSPILTAMRTCFQRVCEQHSWNGAIDLTNERGVYTSTGNISSCFFYSGGVNFLMQLQFLAPVELFFKQLKGYSF